MRFKTAQHAFCIEETVCNDAYKKGGYDHRDRKRGIDVTYLRTRETYGEKIF
jgi:hypothetical protein